MDKYTFSRVDKYGYVIKEYGHTMFPEDAKKALDRKEYLESKILPIQKQINERDQYIEELERCLRFTTRRSLALIELKQAVQKADKEARSSNESE